MSETSITMTEFHRSPGRYVDRSIREPVRLLKQNRVVAMLVNPEDWEQGQAALNALHGNRQVILTEAMDEETVAVLAASRDRLKAEIKASGRRK